MSILKDIFKGFSKSGFFWFFTVLTGIQVVNLILEIQSGNSPTIIAKVTTLKDGTQIIAPSGILAFLALIMILLYFTCLTTFIVQTWWNRMNEQKICTCGHLKKRHSDFLNCCWGGEHVWTRCECKKFQHNKFNKAKFV